VCVCVCVCVCVSHPRCDALCLDGITLGVFTFRFSRSLYLAALAISSLFWKAA